MESFSKALRAEVGEHRTQDLRSILTSLPDIHAPAFKAEAHRQSLAVAQSAQSDEDQAFIDAVSCQSE